jgi:hypothetical protein
VKSGLQGGRFASESVAGIDRNQWPLSIGIGGRLASEYAEKDLEYALIGILFLYFDQKFSQA